MSGSTKAAFNASALMPRPNSHTMYLTRTRPMMRERNVDAINTTVAVKAVCACEGRSAPRARAHPDCGVRKGSVEGELSTYIDSTGNGVGSSAF